MVKKKILIIALAAYFTMQAEQQIEKVFSIECEIAQNNIIRCAGDHYFKVAVGESEDGYKIFYAPQESLEGKKEDWDSPGEERQLPELQGE